MRPDPFPEADAPYDLVIVGAGLAGLTAATAGAEAGLRVLVLEKLSAPGGTLPLASGHLWHDYPLRDDVEDIDPALRGLVSANFESAADWLRAHGIELGPSASRTNGYQVLPEPRTGLLDILLDHLERAGGELKVDTPVTSLERSDDLTVVRAGEQSFPARAVVLATGGFQGDPDLVSAHIAPSDRLFWRSNPGATGDGLRMGLEAGGATTSGMHSFYGHLSPHTGARPVAVEPMVYRRATLGAIEHVIVLNLDGERFIDETRPDVAVSQALARDERAVGVVLFDEEVHRAWVTQRNALPTDARSALVLWRAVGGRVEEADTPAELLEKLLDIGLDIAAARATIAHFNEAAAEGTDETLPVPRRTNLHRFATPPFHAVLVCPDLTFTDGGLRVDAGGHVLRADGEVVPSLYAVGETAGLVSVGSQAGGIATAIVTGLRAARDAAEVTTKVREMKKEL